MKKKILLSVFTLAVVTLTAFTSYKAFGPKKIVANLMLDENIEALTEVETPNGFFVFHTEYVNPNTGLPTGKCTAYSYYGPNGKCSSSHSHNATSCCSIDC